MYGVVVELADTLSSGGSEATRVRSSRIDPSILKLTRRDFLPGFHFHDIACNQNRYLLLKLTLDVSRRRKYAQNL